jgi:uncharacterized protein YcfL
MKKTFIVPFITISLIALLSGCSSNKQENTTNNTKTTQQTVSNNQSKKMFDMTPDDKTLAMTITDQDNDSSIVKRVWIYSYKKQIPVNRPKVSDFNNETAYVYENDNWQSNGTMEQINSIDTDKINSGNKNSIIIDSKQPGIYAFRLISIYSDGRRTSKQGVFVAMDKK